MNTVFGNDAGHDIAAPFINGLAPSPGFVAPPGSPSDVGGGNTGSGSGSPQGKKRGGGHG